MLENHTFRLFPAIFIKQNILSRNDGGEHDWLPLLSGARGSRRGIAVSIRAGIGPGEYTVSEIDYGVVNKGAAPAQASSAATGL